MQEKRVDDRIDFVSIGLVDGNSVKFSCSLENISTSGAFISTNDPIPETLKVGDIICLKAILLSPVELQCKVTRIDAGRIAVQFLDK